MEDDETGILSSWLHAAGYFGGCVLLGWVLRVIFGRKIDAIEQRCREDIPPCGEIQKHTKKQYHVNPERKSGNLFTYSAPQNAQKVSVHSSQGRFYSSQEYCYPRTRSKLACQRESAEHACREEEREFRDYYARSKGRTSQKCHKECTTIGDVGRHDVKFGVRGDCVPNSYGDVRRIPAEKYYGPVRRELHSEIFTHKRQQMEADKFDGSTNVNSYLGKFKRVAKWNGWSYEEKGIQLRMCLKGKADSIVERVLKGMDGEDYESLKRVLTKCLTPVGAINMYRNEFKNRRKRRNEDIQEFGRSIQELAEKAYPEDYNTGLEGILIDKFIRGLDNAAMREHVLYGKPNTLDEAIEFAQETELVQSYEEGLLNERKGEERNKWEEDEKVTASMEAVLRQIKKTMEIFEERMMGKQKEKEQRQKRACHVCGDFLHYARQCPRNKNGRDDKNGNCRGSRDMLCPSHTHMNTRAVEGHNQKTQGKESTPDSRGDLLQRAGFEAGNSNKGRDFDRRSRGNRTREFVCSKRLPFKGKGDSRFKIGKDEMSSPKANQERETSLERDFSVESVVQRNFASPEGEDMADSAQDSVIDTGDNSNSRGRVVEDCTQVSGRGVVKKECVLVNQSKASWETRDLTSSDLVGSPLDSCEKKGLLIERISKLDASDIGVVPEVGDGKRESQTQVKDVSVAQRQSDVLESRDVTDPVDDCLLSAEDRTNFEKRVLVEETCGAEQKAADREGTLAFQSKELQETPASGTEQGSSDQDDSSRCTSVVVQTEQTTKTDESSWDVIDLKKGHGIKVETIDSVNRATKALLVLVWETGWVLPCKFRPPVRPPPWPDPGFWSNLERKATRLFIALI
ncbi:uncharacterized protein [Littorina saxatilis]|uniref:uncharacterized protein n=1 Tax=Littorina saxatilis TaxID=31220 RepID=UPI0038B654D9